MWNILGVTMKRLIIAVFLSIIFLSGCNNNQLDELTKQQKQLQANIQTLESQVEELSTENASLTELAEDLKTQAETLAAEKEELISSAQNLDNLNNSLKAQVDASNSEITKLATKFEQTEAVKTELELKLEKELEAQLTSLELELYQAQKDVERLTAKRTEILERLGRPVTDFVIEENNSDNADDSASETTATETATDDSDSLATDGASETVLNTANDTAEAGVDISTEADVVVEEPQSQNDAADTEDTMQEAPVEDNNQEPAPAEESPTGAIEEDMITTTDGVDISTEAVSDVSENSDNATEQAISTASDNAEATATETSPEANVTVTETTSETAATSEDYQVDSPNGINYDQKPENKTEDSN